MSDLSDLPLLELDHLPNGPSKPAWIGRDCQRTTVQLNVRVRPGLAAEVEHTAMRRGSTVADFARQALQAAVDGYPESLPPHAHQWLARQARIMELADAQEAMRVLLADIVRRYPRGIHIPS